MTETMPSEAPVTYRGAVYPWHCDHMGHMNIMWYAGKFDEANWNFFVLLGITPGYLRSEARGMAALEQSTSYRKELLAGEVVVVRSRLLEMRDKVMRFGHEMVNAESGEVAATTELTAVHLDRTTRRACPFPEAVRVTGEKMLGDGGSEGETPR